MMNVEKVFDDLFVVTQEMRPGWYLSVYVFFGDTIGIVDSGFEETIKEKVLPLIREQGRRPEEVSLIVNTHRDGDHVKGNSALKEVTKSVIACHRLEAEAIPDVDRLLEDGESVKLGDRAFRVLHTPGHRPGAICLHDEENKLLLTDDVVCGTREDLIRMPKNIYIESLRRLQELKVDTMIMSHPFQPAGKNVLNGNEIDSMLQESIEIAEKLRQEPPTK